ncbi:hypothetical protein WN943_025121 [Citrus x changshan-huyou]
MAKESFTIHGVKLSRSNVERSQKRMNEMCKGNLTAALNIGRYKGTEPSGGFAMFSLGNVLAVAVNNFDSGRKRERNRGGTGCKAPDDVWPPTLI